MHNKKGFTVLELMVGIVVFTLGFLGAFMLVESASNASIRSRDEVIGANIMREQIELIKNLRDSNWIQFLAWNSIEQTKSITETDSTFQINNFYTINNNFSLNKVIHTEKIHPFSLSQSIISQEFTKNNSMIRLCIDTIGRYTHDCTNGNIQTNYASFFEVKPLITQNTLTNTALTVEKAYKINTYFVTFNKGYRISSMSTIVSDWKNQ